MIYIYIYKANIYLVPDRHLWCLGLVPERHFWLSGTRCILGISSIHLVPESHFWSLGLVPNTKNVCLGLVPESKKDYEL